MDKDNRLINLLHGQYRVWRDTHTQMIPKGQSISQPLMAEAVRCKTEVYGSVERGYLNPPIVDYLNTNVDTAKFDSYQLMISRVYDEDNVVFPGLPVNTDIDYYTDLGLTKIKANCHLKIGPTNDYVGLFDGPVDFDYVGGAWVTGDIVTSLNAANYCRCVVRLVVNPTADMISEGQLLSTSAMLQGDRMSISVIVKSAVVVSGSSYMPVLTVNTVEWPLGVVEISIALQGGSNG